MENRRLTSSFNLYDFLASETAQKEGIENIPHEAAVCAHLKLVAQHLLEPVHKHFDTRPQITSGYRCPALNARVGGVETSQHLTGQAVDFQLPGTPLREVAAWMQAHLTFDQLLLERSGDEVWIHVSYREGQNRGQVKWFDGENWQPGLPPP